ncbi:hypothetical protein L0222_28710 [bacterium]|nr:hypothetical protein [bacterium]MCI0604105.1 hypothetical protein [bacterium]
MYPLSWTLQSHIGNTTAEDLISKAEPLISRDNSMMFTWVAPVFLNVPHMLQYLGFLSHPNRVPLLLQDRQGKVKKSLCRVKPSLSSKPFQTHTFATIRRVRAGYRHPNWTRDCARGARPACHSDDRSRELAK